KARPYVLFDPFSGWTPGNPRPSGGSEGAKADTPAGKKTPEAHAAPKRPKKPLVAVRVPRPHKPAVTVSVAAKPSGPSAAPTYGGSRGADGSGRGGASVGRASTAPR